ncbi:MAG TPA: SDR family NAD(P)-dependent oxidoreductase [Dehalococcoidia bacterium]|nr:SDR family NAD(P)-dependent oxidoreductase [Dehalococcoidia bacterium]
MAGLEGKVAIVTGAGRMRGIGRAIALRLAEDGADVVVTGAPRDPATFPEHERAQGWKGVASVAEEIEALGQRALALDCDVTKREDARNAVAAALGRFGRVDILVNNAGAAFCGDRPLWEIDQAEWYRVVDVNLNGVYQMCAAVIPAMIEAGRGGRIVNISSTAGRQGIPFYGAYCATKFGVIGLTQMLAQETAAYQITVNCVAPGSVDTDMMDGTFARMAGRYGVAFDAMKQGALRTIPLGRQGRGSDIAAAVAFFASDEASWITGQTLNVNGGTPMD